MKLENEFPNYATAIAQMKDTTDLTLFKSNSNVYSHIMSYIVFGNRLGDIYINLNKHEDFVYVSFATYKGLTEKAKTTGDSIYRDMPVEDWITTIAEVMNKHNANPDHAQLVMNFTRQRVSRSQTGSPVKNSGCMLTFLLIIIPIVTYSIY
ncbi:hypothetical protein [Christiangramia echinicola]|uniref:hypothetical protein n=1 Tax=Christiangramia echinicola TaxID=279359 RepID=UPI000422A081|nr:hypothetical protein [Christiangramia echinicola]